MRLASSAQARWRWPALRHAIVCCVLDTSPPLSAATSPKGTGSFGGDSGSYDGEHSRCISPATARVSSQMCNLSSNLPPRLRNSKAETAAAKGDWKRRPHAREVAS